MRTQLISRKVTRDPHTITFLIGAGGTALTVAEHSSAVDVDVFICADALIPLKDIPDNVFKIALSAGETVGELCSKLTRRTEFDAAIELLVRRNTDTATGFAQRPTLSQIAALVREAEIKRTLHEAKDEAELLTDGSFKKAIIYVDNSNSGGTGSAIGYMLANWLVDILLSETSASIHLKNQRLGAKTYLTLGSHINFNNAVGTIRDLGWVLGKQVSHRVISTLNVYELPQVLDKTAERNVFKLAATQALTSEDLVTALSTAMPNNHQNDELGKLTTTFLRFFMMDGKVNVHACAAMLAQAEMNGLLTEQATAAIPTLTVSSNLKPITPSQHAGLVMLVKHVGQARPADVYAQLEGKYSVNSTIMVKRGAEEAQTLDTVISPTTPKSMESFRERIEWLRALKTALSTLKTSLDKKTKEKKVEFDKKIEDARWEVDKRWSDGNLKAKAAAIGSNPLKIGMALGKILPELEKSEMNYRTEAGNLLAIENAISKVDAEIASLMKNIEKAQEWLQKIANEEGADGDVFTYGGLGAAFESMMKAVQKDSFVAFKNACPKVIDAISLKGLALVSGASASTPVAIIHALMEGKPTRESPWPCGVNREDKDRGSVMVLPRTSDDIFEALNAAATEANCDFNLARLSGVDGVVAIVHVIVFKVREIEDIWSPGDFSAYQKLAENPDDMEVTVVKGAPGIQELEAILTKIKCERKS